MDETVIIIAAGGGGGGLLGRLSTVGGVVYLTMFGVHVVHVAQRVVRDRGNVVEAVRDEVDEYEAEEYGT